MSRCSLTVAQGARVVVGGQIVEFQSGVASVLSFSFLLPQQMGQGLIS